MLNRYSKGSILLKKNVTRKGYRIETNYEFPLSFDGEEITITLSSMNLSDCATCYHLGEKLFEFSPCLSRTFDKYVVIGCYSSDSEYCFVAKHDDRIIGFLLGSIIEKRSNYGYLNWVAVEPYYQVFFSFSHINIIIFFFSVNE